MSGAERVRPAAAAALAMMLAGAAPATAQEAVAEPEGYRMEEYRAPVPETLAGVRVLSTAGRARALGGGRGLRGRPAEPAAPRGPCPEGTIWRPTPRDDIPGSVWLPDTGYGALSPEAAAYLAEGLRRASGDDPDALLVFYCKAECWMSWNAAKRAREELGYADVAWYPEGTDGWAAAGYPLERREPEPD